MMQKSGHIAILTGASRDQVRSGLPYMNAKKMHLGTWTSQDDRCHNEMGNHASIDRRRKSFQEELISSGRGGRDEFHFKYVDNSATSL